MIKETYVESQGGELWTAVQGSGASVVLCSGGPGCCDYLEPVADILKDTTQVIRFEPQGCGRSGTSSHYSVATQLADLEAVRQHYKVDSWTVIGHSWGADLALFYALEHPDRCSGFVCMAGGRVHNDREWHRTYKEKSEAGLELQLDFAYPPNLDVNRQVNDAWKKYIQRSQLLKDLAALKVPALFIYGSEDIRPRWPVEQVAQLLPDADFVLLEGADHYLWLSHAEQLGRHLKDFVATE